MRTTSRALALLAAAPLVLLEPMPMAAIGIGIGASISSAVRAVWPSPNSSSEQVNDEVPAGELDGLNRSFVLAGTPRAGSLVLFVDRARQVLGRDFTYSGQSITFVAESTPQKGATLVAQYLR